MNLARQTVLVTGGSSGIGLALARALQERGSRVLICGRDEGQARRGARMVPRIETVRCDLGDEGDLDTLVEVVQTRLGGSPCSSTTPPCSSTYTFPDTDPEVTVTNIKQEVDINLSAPIRLTAQLLPLLAKEPESAVVNLTSGLALAPKKSAAVYCASKAGLRAFTKALRYQLEDAKLNVRAVEVMLPLVDTPMTQGRGNPRLKLSPERVGAGGAQRDSRQTEAKSGRRCQSVRVAVPPCAGLGRAASPKHLAG
jgi:short-subunit dehydrogenase involved in D-alanine esterification of teichoic acids